MLMKKEYVISSELVVMIGLILFVIIASLGCDSEKRAIRQTNNNLTNHRELIGRLIRERIPCDTTKTVVNVTKADNSDLLNTIEALQSQLYESWIELDSLGKVVVPKEDTTRCKSLLEAFVKLRNENALLQYKLKHLPVIKPDTIRITNSISDHSWEDAYNKDHLWRTERESKDKGNILIRVPISWFIAFLIVCGIAIFAYVKRVNVKQFFNKIKNKANDKTQTRV